MLQNKMTNKTAIKTINIATQNYFTVLMCLIIFNVRDICNFI